MVVTIKGRSGGRKKRRACGWEEGTGQPFKVEAMEDGVEGRGKNAVLSFQLPLDRINLQKTWESFLELLRSFYRCPNHLANICCCICEPLTNFPPCGFQLQDPGPANTPNLLSSLLKNLAFTVVPALGAFPSPELGRSLITPHQ